MKKSIENLYAEIENCHKRIDKIQAKCKHGIVEKKYHSDEGDGYWTSTKYWTNFHCLECNKSWNEEGSK